MKIIACIPALMLDNNRQINFKAMEFAKKHYPLDEFVVYDQEFLESDYKEGFTYIGHQDKRQGFVTPRNELLKYFYNSDADYAFWFDANETVSTPTLNDAVTVLKAIKDNIIDVDAIFSTLGIWVSQERIVAKKREDYHDNVWLTECRKNYNWMHGLLIKNWKKYYDMEVYIDSRCDPRVGSSEDVYFARLIQRLFNCYLCPTITMNKPNNKASTWMANESGYSYPPVDYAKVDEYISEIIDSYKKVRKVIVPNELIVPRVEDYRETLRDYIPRTQKEQPNTTISKVDIW